MKRTTTTQVSVNEIIALDLVDSRAFPKGITIQVYRPTGPRQYAT